MADKFQATIRVAHLSDAALLAELGARTFAETFAKDNTPEDMAAYLRASFSHEQMQSELRDKSCSFLIAEVENEPAGYALMRTSDPPEMIFGKSSIEIVRFYVSSEWHGQGIANALMHECVSQAIQGGYESIWLGVWEHNERAQAFYRKWNFKPIGMHPFELGSDLQNDIVMERVIASELTFTSTSPG